MKHRILIVSALLGLIASAGAGAANPDRMASLEDALEASTSTVTVPASDGGFLYFRDCAPCNSNGLHLTTESRYFVDGVQVTLDQLHKALGTGQSHFMTIFHRPNDSAVTRIVTSR